LYLGSREEEFFDKKLEFLTIVRQNSQKEEFFDEGILLLAVPP
jgi:hypothetical protein